MKGGTEAGSHAALSFVNFNHTPIRILSKSEYKNAWAKFQFLDISLSRYWWAQNVNFSIIGIDTSAVQCISNSSTVYFRHMFGTLLDNQSFLIAVSLRLKLHMCHSHACRWIWSSLSSGRKSRFGILLVLTRRRSGVAPEVRENAKDAIDKSL